MRITAVVDARKFALVERALRVKSGKLGISFVNTMLYASLGRCAPSCGLLAAWRWRT
jgi:hypothetical protein